jgi:hypothetical protein
VWGPDHDRVKDGITTYEQKGYRVLEEWEVPDTAEGRATLAGPAYVRADA